MNFYKGKKVLVTGGAGCIGSFVCELLAGLEAEVTAVDNFMRHEESERNCNEALASHPEVKYIEGDIEDYGSLKNLVSGFDMVFHLAALPSHRLAVLNPRMYLLNDAVGAVNIFEAVRQSNRKIKILFTSTNKVYGKQPTPFREDMEPMPEGPYGQSKLDAERWAKLYHDYYGLDIAVVRLFHVIGPRTQPDREISIFTESVIKGESIHVHGDFKDDKFISCAAGYTDIRDVVAGILKAMEIVKGFEIINLGNSREVPVIDLAEHIMKILGKRVEIIKKQMYQHESLYQSADNSKARKLLGWKPTYTAEESLERYVSWRLRIGDRDAAKYKDKELEDKL